MTIDLNAIKKRAEAATEGPWYYTEIDRYHISPDIEDGAEIAEAYAEHNAVFIAHARQDVPALIELVAQKQAEVERLRTQQARLIAELEKADKFSDELRAELFRQQLPGIRKIVEDCVDDRRIETMEDLKDFYAENRARKIEADREVYEAVCGMIKDMLEKRKEDD
ncbi:hypothetical protein ACNA6I_01170 [Rossellomorea sp. FS2]|uniref:hypothetical protein n=1 Tax=Rossellomorea sp. FS2 TaxID=3391447 RepID=UPI003A4DA5C9